MTRTPANSGKGTLTPFFWGQGALPLFGAAVRRRGRP
jgi:hypothetical protein